MQEDKIKKLNTRAKKTLTLKEVRLNDVNIKKVSDYLLYQKFLNIKDVNRILHSSNDKDFPIGNIIEDKNVVELKEVVLTDQLFFLVQEFCNMDLRAFI